MSVKTKTIGIIFWLLVPIYGLAVLAGSVTYSPIWMLFALIGEMYLIAANIHKRLDNMEKLHDTNEGRSIVVRQRRSLPLNRRFPGEGPDSW